MSFQIFRLLNLFFITPISLIIVFFLFIFNVKKVKAGIKMRWPKNGILPWLNYKKNTQPYWFHCASGEFEYAKPLIRELKALNPNCQIMVTYFSPSYKSNIESDPLVDFSTPLPWDFPATFKNFIEHHNPKMLLVARTDLWPEMLNQCAKKNIPSILFSATGEKKSILTGFVKALLLQKIDHIYAVSDSDKKHYVTMVPEEKITVVGDTKYDQVIFRLKNGKKIKECLKPIKLTIIAGSVWSEDENIILEPFIAAIKKNNLQLIIAPHEISDAHIKNLAENFIKEDLRVSYYTKCDSAEDYDVLIIDTVGVLAELYEWAQIAFIGGSFKSKVHSVMEALGAGNCSIVGPYYLNNREAIEFQKMEINNQISFVKSVSSKKELTKYLEVLIQYFNSYDYKNKSFVIKDKVQSLSGASKLLAEEIKSFAIK